MPISRAKSDTASSHTTSGAVRPANGPGTTHLLSVNCGTDQAEHLTKSLEALGYDPSRIDVSDRDGEGETNVILDAERQIIVTDEETESTMGRPPGGENPRRESSRPAGAAETIVVLRNSLYNAGIDPSTVTPAKEKREYTAA